MVMRLKPIQLLSLLGAGGRFGGLCGGLGPLSDQGLFEGFWHCLKTNSFLGLA